MEYVVIIQINEVSVIQKYLFRLNDLMMMCFYI